MQIRAEFSYRYAKEILQAVAPEELHDIQSVLNDARNILNADKAKSQRDYSTQIKNGLVPIEIEIGHQRLVFPDFFEFAADHAKQNIAAGVLIVTHDPMQFGHDWHCSLASTKLKIASVADWLTVPLLVIAVNP
jgi:hypothetical protein